MPTEKENWTWGSGEQERRNQQSDNENRNVGRARDALSSIGTRSFSTVPIPLNGVRDPPATPPPPRGDVSFFPLMLPMPMDRKLETVPPRALVMELVHESSFALEDQEEEVPEMLEGVELGGGPREESRREAEEEKAGVEGSLLPRLGETSRIVEVVETPVSSLRWAEVEAVAAASRPISGEREEKEKLPNVERGRAKPPYEDEGRGAAAALSEESASEEEDAEEAADNCALLSW